ncbi:MAG: TIGR00266 family protein [Thermomicrobiales bacterium]|nr:TIGR00266 family protein [Thermomicrobiales bacterium]
MNTELLYQPAFAVCRATLDRGEKIRVEGGAMIAMSDVSVETQATGGLLKSLKRSVLGGETFFQNTYTAESNESYIMLGPALPGDIMVMDLRNEDLIVQAGSFMASAIDIDVNTDWGGARTFFGGEGLFMLRCSGTGKLIVSSYGAIHKVDLAAGQEFVVDTGHIVAFDAGMTYDVRKFGNWKSTIAGGEGFVVNYTGPGTLYLQTRSQQSFLQWLLPNIPSDRSN